MSKNNLEVTIKGINREKLVKCYSIKAIAQFIKISFVKNNDNYDIYVPFKNIDSYIDYYMPNGSGFRSLKSVTIFTNYSNTMLDNLFGKE